MPIQSDQRYDAVVYGARSTEAKDGKFGIRVTFDCLVNGKPEGKADKTIWITQNNREQSEKELRAMGVTSEDLARREFWADPGSLLRGRECSVVTEEREYRGNLHIEVKWINRRVKPASESAIERAMAVFASGGSSAFESSGFDDDPGPEDPPW